MRLKRKVVRPVSELQTCEAGCSPKTFKRNLPTDEYLCEICGISESKKSVKTKECLQIIQKIVDLDGEHTLVVVVVVVKVGF